MVIKITLDPWQKEFLATKGDKILCTGRQVGKTEICAMDAAEYAVKPDNPHPILMTAPTERQAYILFDKTLKYLMENYPKKVIIKGAKRPTRTKINLTNKIQIYCLPTGQFGLGIRGLTIGRSYEDENARVSQEIEGAIAPMILTTGGARIKLSTPAGAVGEFYNTWINKDNAYKSYTKFSIDSETVIRNRKICKTWTVKQRDAGLRLIEQAKARMSKNMYAQEFMGDFIESFHRWFPDNLIKKCCILKKRPSIILGKDYYMGCDIARMGEDEGTIEILDYINKTDLQHVENIITKKQLTPETEKRIINVSQQYNHTNKIYIDAGAGTLGVSVFDHLLDDDRTKRKVVAINNATRIIERATNRKSKDKKTKLLKVDLYDNMRALMERGILKLLDDDEVIASLQSIQYEYVMAEGQPTRLKIFGNYSHIVEGLTRASWCVKEKALNIWVSF